MSETDPQVPPAGEEIHLPGASIQPFLLAVGLTLALIGVTISWYITIFGGILSLGVIVAWIRDTRHEISELPLEHE